MLYNVILQAADLHFAVLKRLFGSRSQNILMAMASGSEHLGQNMSTMSFFLSSSSACASMHASHRVHLVGSRLPVFLLQNWKRAMGLRD